MKKIKIKNIVMIILTLYLFNSAVTLKDLSERNKALTKEYQRLVKIEKEKTEQKKLYEEMITQYENPEYLEKLGRSMGYLRPNEYKYVDISQENEVEESRWVL